MKKATIREKAAVRLANLKEGYPKQRLSVRAGQGRSDHRVIKPADTSGDTIKPRGPFDRTRVEDVPVGRRRR